MTTTHHPPRTIDYIDLGLIDYDAAYNIQKKAVGEVISGGPERIFLCEHPAVLTLGRMANKNFILAPKEELARRRIRVLLIDRGGEVTLHAPGQLVVYPILNLIRHGKDLHAYIRRLEETAIDFLKCYHIPAQRNSCKTGVWAGAKKIVSIGVGVKKWVSFHGMAININTDLKSFSLIKPCGMDVDMTSVAQIKGRQVDLQDARMRFRDIFSKHFSSDSS